ncbi:MAG: hypothetical protein L6R39_001759 [Caloplaca ligustica]|nr:MAG: hypothetical protein L6R39_001759 [Caloplaca ligustica]
MHVIIAFSVPFLALLFNVLAIPHSYVLEKPGSESKAVARGLPWPGYTIVRHVPGTRTIIYVDVEETPIEPKVILSTLRLSQILIEAKIRAEGAWDPYRSDPGMGCYVYAESNDKPPSGQPKQHLTWGIMGSTFSGLLSVAAMGYTQEMKFKVLNGSQGFVSSGYIRAGSLRGDLIRAHRTANFSLDDS